MGTMKDSGIQYLGKIPCDWGVVPVKYFFEISRGRVISVLDLDNNGMYPVYSSQTENSGCFGYLNTYDYSGPAITWTTDGAKAGTVFYRDGKYNCTNVCGILQLKNQCKSSVDMHFATYAIRMAAEQNKRYDINGFKIMSNEMAAIRFALPPYALQTSISDFLDSKCAEVDALAADIQKEIDVLERYKRSVIAEAVTKGLDRNVTMRDSGIQWIGQIPENWTLNRIKNLFYVVSGATPSPETANWDGDISWVTPADYKTKDKYVSHGKRNLSSLGYTSCSTVLVPAGSLVFSKRAPIGTVAIAAEPLCTNQGCLACVKKNEHVNTEYYYYVLSIGTEHFELMGSGTTFKEISANSFANCSVPFPAFSEQCQIAKHLSAKCSEIDSIIATKQKQLSVLDAYKKSVIYEYVTGKKEVH